jgi:hypothetical protein
MRIARHEWIGPVFALVGCLSAAALAWYGISVLLDHDPNATGSLIEH